MPDSLERKADKAIKSLSEKTFNLGDLIDLQKVKQDFVECLKNLKLRQEEELIMRGIVLTHSLGKGREINYLGVQILKVSNEREEVVYTYDPAIGGGGTGLYKR